MTVGRWGRATRRMPSAYAVSRALAPRSTAAPLPIKMWLGRSCFRGPISLHLLRRVLTSARIEKIVRQGIEAHSKKLHTCLSISTTRRASGPHTPNMKKLRADATTTVSSVISTSAAPTMMFPSSARLA